MRIRKGFATLVREKVLWESFGDKPFRFGDAAKILMDKCKDVWEQVPMVLSELRKAGYPYVESDPKDVRQKNSSYTAKKRTQAFLHSQK